MIKHLIIFLTIFSAQLIAIVFPIYSYSEDSGSLYGAFGQHTINKTQDSSIQWFAMSQSSGQNAYIKSNNIIIKDQIFNISIYASNTGNTSYGVQNYTTTTGTRVFAYSLKTTIETEQPITNHWDLLFAIKTNIYNERESKNENINYFDNINEIGATLGIQNDTRDKEINTKTGHYHTIQAIIFPSYQILSNDYRQFNQTSYGNLAFKFYSAQTISNTDHIDYFQTVGNYYYLRGYSTNQYADHHLSYSQIELRSNVTSWLTFVPFIEYGGIGSSITDINKWLFSYGYAFHIPLDTSTFRIEMAHAKSNSKFYFGFNHVF